MFSTDHHQKKKKKKWYRYIVHVPLVSNGINVIVDENHTQTIAGIILNVLLTYQIK